ncbi:hypothetical protein SLEP1_g14199 [Rubroshorea leprosula]|uniref:Transposase (putative) gypsy type domain-containing protein n=1 Tax=Rubroshorea leprosula TaxID=152421 RepID=A0AAV5ISB7_9ROSI|nr:hypothetical protein SLEP1_g14199 [Rubroshorea leprosula]
MDSFRGLIELRGNQGREGEEEGVISVEPVAMIVPPVLQDLLETLTPENSASSSARDDGGDHHASPSSSSSSKETPSREGETGNVVGCERNLPVVEEWENRVITGRLSNLCKAPKELPSGFRFRAALHHEVADSAPSISGYRKLEEMIPVYVDHFKASLRFPLPGLIFDLLADYELALTQLMPNSIRFIIGFMLLCERLEVPAKAIVFRSLFQCRLCPNSRGAKWYYLSRREKSQLFKNVRNKVARWKRQFIFVRNMRIERISNNLAARLFEWRVPNAHVNYPQLLPQDTDIKNQLLEYTRRENLIDIEALVTSEQLAVFGFIDVANLFTEGEMSNILERQRQQAQGSRGHAAGSRSQRQTQFDERPPPAPQSRNLSHRSSSSASRPRAEQRVEVVAPSARRRAREETDSEDEVPLTRRRTSVGAWPAQVAQTAAARSSDAPSATTQAVGEPASASASVSAPQFAFPDGFSYVKPDCQPAMVQGMQSSLPPVDRQRARTFVQQHGGQVAMVKLMDAFSYAVALFESEQAARSQNNELSANCKQLAVEKASLVDDVNRLQGSEMANRAIAAKSRADELVNRNNELREELERARTEKESEIQATKDEAACVEERAKKAEAERDHALNELSSLRRQTSHRRSISMARAQGAEWLVASAVFQDAVAVVSTNMTTEIYNEIRGKVLHHRPDFPIHELAFFDGEDIDEQGKSLAPLVDTTVRLRCDLNEEGVPVWPPSEPSSTPPNSQPTVVSARSPANAPAPEPAARTPPACSFPLAADASMPVDLMDD